MEQGANPRDIKIELARELVARFHGEEAAANAHKGAGNLVQEGEVPEDTPHVILELDDQTDLPIAAIVNRAGLAANAAQTRDMLKNGRVKVDWEIAGADRSAIRYC